MDVSTNYTEIIVDLLNNGQNPEIQQSGLDLERICTLAEMGFAVSRFKRAFGRGTDARWQSTLFLRRTPHIYTVRLYPLHPLLFECICYGARAWRMM